MCFFFGLVRGRNENGDETDGIHKNSQYIHVKSMFLYEKASMQERMIFQVQIE